MFTIEVPEIECELGEAGESDIGGNENILEWRGLIVFPFFLPLLSTVSNRACKAGDVERSILFIGPDMGCKAASKDRPCPWIGTGISFLEGGSSWPFICS